MHKDGYVLAASQDLYNGRHTSDSFQTECEISNQGINDTNLQCGAACGVCFMVSGSQGYAVFIVQVM